MTFVDESGFFFQKISKMNVNTHASRILVKGNGPFRTFISVIWMAVHVVVHFYPGDKFRFHLFLNMVL